MSPIFYSLIAVAVGLLVFGGLWIWLRPLPLNPSVGPLVESGLMAALGVTLIPLAFIWFEVGAFYFYLVGGFGLALLPVAGIGLFVAVRQARQYDRILTDLEAGRALARWTYAPAEYEAFAAADLERRRKAAWQDLLVAVGIGPVGAIVILISGGSWLLAVSPFLAGLPVSLGRYLTYRGLQPRARGAEPGEIRFAPGGLLMFGRFVPLTGTNLRLGSARFTPAPPQLHLVTLVQLRSGFRKDSLVIPVPARYLTEAEALAARYQPYVKKD